MKKILVFLLLFFSMKGFGQNAVFDSLQKNINHWQKVPASIERDTNLILSMGAVSDFLSNQVNPRAKNVLDSLKILINNQPNWIRGSAIYERGIGKYHDRRGEYSQAILHYLKANEKYEKIKYDIEGQSFSYILTGFVFNNNKKSKECMPYMEKAISLSKKLKNTSNLCFIYDFYGDYNYYSDYGIKDFNKALYFYKIVEKLLPRNKNPFHFADNPHGIANCYFRLGNNKLGQFYFDKTIRIAHSLHQKNVLFATYDNVGEIFLDQKNYKKAIEFMEKGLAYAKADKVPEFISRAERSMVEVYRTAGLYKSALEHFESYTNLEDSLDRNKFKSEFDKLNIQLQVEKQQTHIIELEKNQLTQTRNVLSLAGLLALSIIGYVFWNNQKLKKKNEEIQTALLQGQTTERKRMASELHDNISNKILGVKMRVEMLENDHFTEKEKTNYEATLGFIDEVYSDIRLVSHNLLPEELETKGLEIAIENLVKKINLIGKTHFENSINTLSRFSPRLEYEIYNVILELVNNILKHAEAKNALISIFQENNLLKIIVKDNGKGFDNQSINFDSLGLKNIHSRIEALRGKIDILNNNGTEVLIEVPV
jgi:two-component system, NarL family, sensor kinase